MNITVKLYGNLKKYMPEKKETAPMEIEEDTTIFKLLARFGVPDAEVWMSAVNDTVVDESTVLHDGDVLEVFEPVGGGWKLEVGGWKLEVRGWRLEGGN